MINLSEKFFVSYRPGAKPGYYSLCYSDGSEYGLFQKIDEAQGFSNVWRHENGKGFVTLSAFRSEVPTREENLQRHKKLVAKLRSLKIGYYEINGAYQDEKYLKPNEAGELRADPNSPVDYELSVFVPFQENKNFGTIAEMAEVLWNIACGEFEQDSIMVVRPLGDDGKRVAYFLNKAHEKQVIGHGISYDKATQYFSQFVKGSHAGRKFVVEAAVRVPISINERRSFDLKGILTVR